MYGEVDVVDIPEEALEVVAAGAVALDRIRAGWFNEVDSFILNMLDGKNCIVGQLWGSYSAHEVQVALLIDASLFNRNDEEVVTIMVEHGLLCTSQTVGLYNYVDLRRAWQREIDKRLYELQPVW